jgi:hypothetical protein
MLLCVAGNETTRTVTSHGIHCLIRHRGEMQRVQRALSLLESAVTYGDSTFNPAQGTWSQGFDAAGNLRGYSVDVYENGSPRYTTTYMLGY